MKCLPILCILVDRSKKHWKLFLWYQKKKTLYFPQTIVIFQMTEQERGQYNKPYVYVSKIWGGYFLNDHQIRAQSLMKSKGQKISFTMVLYTLSYTSLGVLTFKSQMPYLQNSNGSRKYTRKYFLSCSTFQHRQYVVTKTSFWLTGICNGL